MRIAYFTDTYHPQINGVTHTLKKLENYLSTSDHEYRFFAPKYTSEEDHVSESILRINSIQFPMYPECRLSIPFYLNIKAELDAFEPDLIHVVTPLGIGLSGLRYAKERNIPIVSSFHTNFDTYLQYYNLKPLESMLWHIFRHFHSQCLINFCPSMDTKKTLEANSIPEVRIWSRGINTEDFSPNNKDLAYMNTFSNYSSKKAPLRILYTGRLAVEKDLDILMLAAKKLNAKYDHLEFILVGDGPQKEPLMKEAPENMIFTGYQKGKQLSKVYASCDIFAFPSTTETFGNVVLEAMASGLAVVCANAGGVVENVFHNENGLLTEPRDVDSFTDALESLIESNGLREKLRNASIEYVSKKSWDSVFDLLIEDYQSIFENTDIIHIRKHA